MDGPRFIPAGELDIFIYDYTVELVKCHYITTTNKSPAVDLNLIQTNHSLMYIHIMEIYTDIIPVIALILNLQK